MPQTLGSQKLGQFIANIQAENPELVFARKIMAAAREHPLIRTVRKPETRRVRCWAEGRVMPSVANQQLIQMATGGELRLPSTQPIMAWAIFGGDVPAEDWGKPPEGGQP